MQIISKKEAKINELKRFFTGIPCKKYGHVTERLTSSGECMGCKQHREKRKYHQTGGERHKQWYQKNREENVQKQMDRQNANHAEYLEYQKKWRDANKDYRASYQKENASYFAAQSAKRISVKLNATPIWVEIEKIKLLYEESANLTKETGVEHQVDHIIPLISGVVCGLHCFENLQILTAEENKSKGNRLEL